MTWALKGNRKGKAKLAKATRLRSSLKNANAMTMAKSLLKNWIDKSHNFIDFKT